MNIGYFDRLMYDPQVAEEKIFESTGPLMYRINTNYNYHKNSCASVTGPRSSYMGYGVSDFGGNVVAPSQAPENVDIESVLSGRETKHSKLKKGGVTTINMAEVNKKLKHPKMCNNVLDPTHSRLEFPASTLRDGSINRFYDLIKNPQEHIFWEFGKNTRKEATDNFVYKNLPIMKEDRALPPRPKKFVSTCNTGSTLYCANGVITTN